MEVIESSLGIIDIPSVSQGIQGTQGGCHRAAGFEKLAPGVVGVGDNCGAGGVQKGNHIPLQIGGVIVGVQKVTLVGIVVTIVCVKKDGSISPHRTVPRAMC